MCSYYILSVKSDVYTMDRPYSAQAIYSDGLVLNMTLYIYIYMYPVYCGVFIYWFVANISADFGIQYILHSLLVSPKEHLQGLKCHGEFGLKQILVVLQEEFIHLILVHHSAGQLYTVCALRTKLSQFSRSQSHPRIFLNREFLGEGTCYVTVQMDVERTHAHMWLKR